MGYYRKGHYKRDGTWVSGHYVNKYSRKKFQNGPGGCALIFFGGIISVLVYLFS
ncbi:hypothetical protein ACNFU2_14370 [Chryseobacterium sp. PTM-20240506]|nr:MULTISPECIES: hypothetical protein [unclassified Chryseobacterium]MDC8106070.1 hypothetical protein [Chryseobacterium sp. B21-037]MDQ1804574.1 hypothetical protein [Chryseobacterium sp. CKR4-1]WBV55284.1 hypothetical protein PFY10_13705 [Chryseobacterium daecheongense]